MRYRTDLYSSIKNKIHGCKGGINKMYTQVKTSYQEPLYTLSEAEKLIDWNRHKTTQKKKIKKRYFIKQKLSGVATLLIGIATPILLQDLTLSIFAIPFGVFLIVTKQKVMTIN